MDNKLYSLEIKPREELVELSPYFGGEFLEWLCSCGGVEARKNSETQFVSVCEFNGMKRLILKEWCKEIKEIDQKKTVEAPVITKEYELTESLKKKENEIYVLNEKISELKRSLEVALSEKQKFSEINDDSLNQIRKLTENNQELEGRVSNLYREIEFRDRAIDSLCYLRPNVLKQNISLESDRRNGIARFLKSGFYKND